MNQWNITAVRQQDREKYGSLVLTEWKNIAFEPETELLVAFCSGAAHGALLARIGHGRYEAVSLFVEEGSRRRGAASALLEAAERSGMLRGCGTLRAVYAAPETEKDMLHRFFLTRGFVLPREGAALYTLPVRSLEHSYLAKLPAASRHALAHIVPMENYLARSGRRFAVSLGRQIPQALDPARAPGEVLWKYSGAYVENERLVSFVIFSGMERTIHLHAAYLSEPKYGAALVALLCRAYGMLAADFPRFDIFSVTVINAPAERLARKLLSGADAVYRRVFYTQKPLVREVPVMPEWGGILARSNALVRAMADAGFGTSLCLEPGASPYLLWSPREGMEISVCYRVKNEEYTEFSLTAQLLVRVERAEDAERIAQIMSEDPGPGLLRPSDEEYLFGLCAVRSEGAEFAPEESVEGFLMDFSAQAQRLVRLPGIRTVS